MQRRLVVQLQCWRNATDYAVRRLQVLAAAELVARLAEQHDHIALGPEGASHDGTGVLDKADHSKHWRGQDCTSVGLVVQTYVAAGNWDVERPARRPHSLHRAR